MFLNLIDTSLQERIAMSQDLDGNAAEALKASFGKRTDINDSRLDDWKV